MLWPRFAFPWALLLLALVPWAIYVGRQVRSLSAGRKAVAVFLRTLILLALIGAAAGAELVKRSDKLAVFFLLDQSNSIPENARLAAVDAIKRIAETYMTPKDEAGVIVFGEEPSIELSVEPNLAFERVLSYVGAEQTDAAAAVRLAMAAFPQGCMRRMVLFSDGNETKGSAFEEAKLAQAAGVEVDTVPILVQGGNEVRIREVASPNRANAGEPFQVRVAVSADQDCEGTLQLYQRTREGRRMMPPTNVTLRKGENVFLLPQELTAAGFYEYEATIESPSDTVSANNVGRTFTVVHGEPSVLYIDGDTGGTSNLAAALESEGLRVTVSDFANMPASLAQFQSFDALVLSDVSSTDLSVDQLRGIEAMVRDLGIGLVMVGGPRSFGAGGFHGTPVESALPVSMDVKDRKILPRGALVLIMHTCEIADGNAWAREIGLASLNVLSSQDLMGAVAYLYPKGEDWVFPLGPVGDKSAMRAALMRADPGDMPQMGPTLDKASDALATADAAIKRIVIISDGDPAAPTRGTVERAIARKISVSTICIAPHSMSDQTMLKRIADATGGEYYYVTDPKKLPQIFAKEAAVVKGSLLMEEEFVPQVKHDSELIEGLRGAAFPKLLGYVVTSPKDNATIPLVTHKGDPLLAHWRFGLGKSVAFTSDATNRWAAAWLGWEDFNRFWAQCVRWSMREISRSEFRTETKTAEGKGYIKIDAVDDQGDFVNFLRPRGVVTGPGPEFARQDVTLSQTGPGIYEGTFPIDNAGVYLINLVYDNPDGTRGAIPAGLAVNYSREYEYNTTNVPRLEQIASAGGGAVLGPDDNPFQHNLVASATVTPVWQYLAGFAASLFPVEIFIRRVLFDPLAPLTLLASLLRKIPALRRWMRPPAPRAAPVTGAYGSAAPAQTFAYSPGEPEAQVFGADAASRPSAGARVPPLEGQQLPQEAPPKQPPGSSEYTRQLLAAKERARELTSRRTVRLESDRETLPRPEDTDKENT